MNITDDDIRNGLNNYADSIQTTPPPIGRLTRETAVPLSSRRRPARRPVLAGIAVAGALLGAGVAAATGVFSAGTTEFVESVCGLNIDDARLVASDTDSLGNLVEFSVINGPTGDATIVGVKDPQGTWTYDEAGCGPWPGGAENPTGRPWVGSPNLTLDGQATLIRVYGWIPQPATTAVVTFADGTTTRIDAGPEGYFLHLITTAPDANAAITHIEARTTTDTLVAEGNPLG